MDEHVMLGLERLDLDLVSNGSRRSSMEEVPLWDDDGGSRVMYSGPICDVPAVARMKLAELYCLWACRPESKALVEVVLADPTNVTMTPNHTSGSSTQIPKCLPQLELVNREFTSTRSLPKSPVSTLIRSTVIFPGSPLTSSRIEGGLFRESSPLASTSFVARNISMGAQFALSDTDFDLGESATSTQMIKKPSLPKFYFPAGEDGEEQEKIERELITTIFTNSPTHANGHRILNELDVATLMRDVIGLPSFLTELIFEQCEAKNAESTSDASILVSYDTFQANYDKKFALQPPYMRLFNMLRSSPKATFLTRNDLGQVVHQLLIQHPGLAFLESTPQFQQRYLETVIERIFYTCARRHPNRLYPKELEVGGILHALTQVDQDEDINCERRFLSYEHFYVLYCRFWELDLDHDMRIDQEDLLSYGGHSLSCRIVERIFMGVAKPLGGEKREKMTYTDFIWFCLSEEDKTNERALNYWFRCVDLDGDGIITLYDMEFFYEEQIHRMECLGHEPITFANIASQLLDMLDPGGNDVAITREVLRQSKLQSNFFNILFNINRLFSLEGKDLRAIRNQRETPHLTEWDRFAMAEYHRLSSEDDIEDASSISF